MTCPVSAETYRTPGYTHATLRGFALAELAAEFDRGPLRRVLAARLGRIALGRWLALCMAVMALCAFDEGEAATRVLCGAWLLAPIAALAGWTWGYLRGRTRLLARAGTALDREVLSVDSGKRFHRAPGLEAALARAGVPEGRSVSWLLLGLALMAPLGIHLAVRPMLEASFGNMASADRFAPWIRVSLLLTGLAHGVLAWRGWAHGTCVALTPTGESIRGSTGLKALGWTVLAGAFPGVVFAGIPPVLVAVTGLCFVPLAWQWTTRRALRERALLATSARDVTA